MQGGPLNHVIAAKATCFAIAGSDVFRDYQQQVRTNADAYASELQAGGLDVLTGGTRHHLLLVDLRPTEWTGKDAEERLAEVAITVNRNTIPFDERPPTVASGLRAGRRQPRCAASTRTTSARWGGSHARRWPRTPTFPALRDRSLALCDERPLYPGFRGYTTYVSH